MAAEIAATDPDQCGIGSSFWGWQDLAALSAGGLDRLEREWRRRIPERRLWSAHPAIVRREVEYARVWSRLLGGDFGVEGRGVDYTGGLEVFQACRWTGTLTLLRLLGAARGVREASTAPGLFLDVLGGDGYVWRLLRASERIDDGADAAAGLLVTNDISPHMFLRAGLWGFPTREEAGRLSRTFRPSVFDGVLFAYGTHHIDSIERALAEAHGILRPGGRIVVHDFLDEGPVGDWFHGVVHPYSKTGHDFGHINWLRMAVGLLLAGFRDVELFEVDDPFVFSRPATGGATAREAALWHLAGMYGLHEALSDEPARLERLIEETFRYESEGTVPMIDDDLVFIPRRAVVARARKPAGGAPDLSPTDLDLAAGLADLLTHPLRSVERLPNLPSDVRDHWLGRDAVWGVGDAVRRLFLDWQQSIPRQPFTKGMETK